MDFEASKTAGWHALVFVGMDFEASAPPHGHEAVAMPPAHNGMEETVRRQCGDGKVGAVGRSGSSGKSAERSHGLPDIRASGEACTGRTGRIKGFRRAYCSTIGGLGYAERFTPCDSELIPVASDRWGAVPPNLP
jgi:hypothetical protein